MRLLAQDAEETLAVQVSIDEELLNLENELFKYLEVLLLFLTREDIFDRASRDKELFRTNNGKEAKHEPQVENILRAERPHLRRVRQRHLVLRKVELQVLPRQRIIPLLQDELNLFKILL